MSQTKHEIKQYFFRFFKLFGRNSEKSTLDHHEINNKTSKDLEGITINKNDLKLIIDNRVGNEQIAEDKDFYTDLVYLSRLGIKRKETSEEFYDKVARLLGYIYVTKNSEHALLLTETLIEIQTYAKLYIRDKADLHALLFDMFSISFEKFKVPIFLNTLRLINCTKGNGSQVRTIEKMIESTLNTVEGSIYECFNLSLTLELLRTYLTINRDNAKKLYNDLLIDLKDFKDDISEEEIEKLLWYGFLFETGKNLKNQISNFDQIIKDSTRWGIKFYRFIRRNLEKETPDSEKINRTMERFKKLKSYSDIEKETIILKIQTELSKKKTKINTSLSMTPVIKEQNYESYKNIITSVTRLHLINLPRHIKLKDIIHEAIADLEVYENESRIRRTKLIRVKGLRTLNGKEVYVGETTLKSLIDESKPGYIHVIDNLKMEKQKGKEESYISFKWPSTEITGTGFETDNGLSMKSDLRKLGYQITDSSREQRWIVLQRAVPAIGLKKVAYTIAGNIKLRKGQKNGRTKFSHAISEWEYDLQRLKAKFYRRDFKWPNT